jgi:L-threonylcarbamoyladenylate synthase
MPEVLEIDPRRPEPHLIARAAAILKAGGVVAFPTETFYGLAADAANEKAVGKIFHVKGRGFSNPIALIIGSDRRLQELVEEIPDAAQILMRAFWPGPLTLVFKASPKVLPKLTAGTGRIGIRVSSHPIAAGLAEALDGPITATSANRSGGAENVSAQDVLQCLGEGLDAIIDGGAAPGGRGSTFLDVTADPPVVLREGAIAVELILEALRGKA